MENIMSKPDPTKALFAFFDDNEDVSFVWGRRYSELPDLEKLEVLNTAIEMLMEQTGNVITSLTVQRTSARGHNQIQ